MASVPVRPDLKAHQALDVFALWLAWEEESGNQQDVPYWATAWPAAQLLALVFQEQPEIVAGKSVLDFGCGSGITGIAALKAGARSVLANDIDPVALEMAQRNAVANQITLNTQTGNLLSQSPATDVEVILVADLFYDRFISEALVVWLGKARKQGSHVFIADAGRPFSPQVDVQILRQEVYPTDLDLEGRSERVVRLLAFQP